MPFYPDNRSSAHINETEYLTEILRAVLWSSDLPDLVMCGITDNTCSDMRFSKGRAKRGAGLRLTRTFHRWLLEKQFRMCSVYCRSGRNLTADFLSRASTIELEEWAGSHNMTRVNPLPIWEQFCLNIQPVWPDWPKPSRNVPPIAHHSFTIVEWQPSSYTLCEDAKVLGRSCSWIDPRRARIARQVALHGWAEYFPGPIHFLGGLAKDVPEAWQFRSTFIGLHCLQGLLIAPPLIEIHLIGFTPFKHHGAIDSAILGDILDAKWNIYSFGTFDIPSFF